MGCEACGAQTTNPRFCSRSCAAKINNVVAPKRRVQGTCPSCFKPMSKREAKCLECRWRDKQGLTIYHLRGPEGKVALESPIVCAETVRVFRYSWMSRRIDLKRTQCGEVIDRLLTIIACKAEYLSEWECGWLAVMLIALKEHVPQRHYKVSGAGKPVSKQPISLIGACLEDWISSHDNQAVRTLSSFALATAEFVKAHVLGHPARDRIHKWEIQGMVDSGKPRQALVGSFGFLDSPRFKKYAITSEVYGIVAAKVPEHHSVEFVRKSLGPLKAGDHFYFEIERCHLSKGLYEGSFFTIKGKPEGIRLHKNFEFRGKLLCSDDETSVEMPLTAFVPRGYEGYLPASWIQYEVYCGEDMDWRAQLLPSWIVQQPDVKPLPSIL